LEKAYAKAMGGYWNIRGRTLEEVLYDLTGCPIDVIHLAVRFFKFLEHFLQNLRKTFFRANFENSIFFTLFEPFSSNPWIAQI
jgi:hypothetical protein